MGITLVRRLLILAAPLALAASVAAAHAAGCPGKPGALGTSRTIVVDPAEHARIGGMNYGETLPLADKEVVLASLWSTRLGVAIDKGASLGAQWNQNMVLVQSYGIPKGSKNVEAALKFIDFSLSPDIQSAWMRAYKAIPVNKKSYPATAPELLDPKTNLPWTQAGFRRDIDWWAANRTKVNGVWQKWVLR